MNQELYGKLPKYNYILFGTNYEVVVEKDTYEYGGTAIILKSYDSEFDYWEPFMVASVFIEDFTESLPENQVCIKDYSENTGVLEWLQNNGIVGPVLGYVESGFVTVPYVEIFI